MSKHSVIVGANGRLGSALRTACGAAGHTVTSLGRREMDLADEASINATLETLDYDTLWLTAALTNVDYCESHPDQTEKVNALAVETIARISARKGAQVIFFSTDYVFDGEKKELYQEDDHTHPLSVYGASKARAEERLLGQSATNLVIRLSWLFGENKPGFPEWVIGKAMGDEAFSVVANRWASPTYTQDVISALQPMIDGEFEVSGILHLCNQGVCSWQEWAQYCVDCAVESGVPIHTSNIESCLMSDIKSFVAQRPAYSAMSSERYQTLSGQTMPYWKQGVNRYVNDYLAPQLKK
ncbi:MAG: dTDP-4-dehydrorhamnose reductase [Verrucomicrobiota bacterium]